jgi:hypothetical protein
MRTAEGFALLAVLAPGLSAQATAPRVSDLRFSVGVQLMGVHTQGAQADIGSGRLEPVEDRFDLFARRARLSISGRLEENIEFRLVLYYDNLGKDRFGGTRSTPNEGTVGVWDAFWTWHAQPTWANLTVGYFRPQIGRENITSGFQTNSNMDKLPTQVYQRQHTVGRSSGREVGVNLGGFRNYGKWSLNYNGGFFDTSHEKVTGQAFGGSKWAPLLVGRAALTLGQPEMRQYGIDYVVNHFNQRKGVTFASAYARQGDNNAFQRNETVNLDALANYGPWNLDAEYDFMKRRTLAGRDYLDRAWHVRAGYNIRVRTWWVEPVAAVMRFRGDRFSPFPGGRDRYLDFGVNWYVQNTRVKLNVHHTRQSGTSVSNCTDGRTFLRGNLTGIGMQFVY